MTTPAAAEGTAADDASDSSVLPAAPGPLRPSDWRIAVWRSFLRAHSTVMRDLERELAAAGMQIGWYDVLLQLVEAPGHRLRMADLADRVLLSRSGLTRLIDRLQAEGYVRREPSPDDARGTYTVLTRPGFEALRKVVPVHLAGVRDHWIARFSDEELRTMGELFGRVVADPETPRAE